MKRFNVQGMRLYYSSLEEAIKNNPDTEITECNDTDYLTDITKIKECFQFAGFLSHDEHSVRELYKGKILMRLLKFCYLEILQIMFTTITLDTVDR